MPKAPVPVSPVLRKFYDAFSTKIASIDLAEKWDNVGFLIETRRSAEYKKLKIVTCIDLTKSVVDEALRLGCNLIVSYHPILFRPIQSLSMFNNEAVLHCLDANISVFSPHTALDNAGGGMNDFYCDMVGELESNRLPVRVEPQSGANIGRISYFSSPVSMMEIINILKSKLNLGHVRYAVAGDISEISLRSMGVCVGSGSSVLSGCDADLYLTGEMSHHEILSAVGLGKAVIMLDHSSSERPYLPTLARRMEEFDCVESVVVSITDLEPIRMV